MLFLFIIPVGVGANDMSIIFADTIVAADTVLATSYRVDTVYSPSFRVSDFSRLWFSLSLEAEPTDTNWANDTFDVAIESSYDDKNWILFSTAAYQRILKGANDTVDIRPSGIVARDSLNFGNYMRVRWVHRDSISEDASGDALPGNIYRTKLTAWLSGIK